MKLSYVIALLFLSQAVLAQVRYQQTGESITTISGTSTLHDWSMTSKQASYQVVFENDETGTPTAIKSLTYTVDCESLKSGHSAMDKNAYSTLNTDEFKRIAFTLTQGKIVGNEIQCEGNLVVMGNTKPVKVTSKFKMLSSGAVSCTATYQLKMSDFGVDPPVFMFGTIRTGDEINVSLRVTLVRR